MKNEERQRDRLELGVQPAKKGVITDVHVMNTPFFFCYLFFSTITLYRGMIFKIPVSSW